MCLISKWRFPKKAKKDITCYKLLMVLPINPEKIQFVTPFMHDVIDIHKPIIAASNGTLLEKWCDGITSPYTKTYGYIHTYFNKEEAEECADSLGLSNYEIFKCIIPKGTKYHIGIKGDYCSKMIVIL